MLARLLTGSKRCVWHPPTSVTTGASGIIKTGLSQHLNIHSRYHTRAHQRSFLCAFSTQHVRTTSILCPFQTRPFTQLSSRSSPAPTPPLRVRENIYTLPNLLTTTRIFTAPLIPYFLLTGQPTPAFLVFTYSALTDLIDGWLARRFNLGTVLGSILDPFADKLLMTLATGALYLTGVFPWWLAGVILGRDALLLLSALYFRYVSLPPEFRGAKTYWDFSLPSARVDPTEISKINTLLQFLIVACGMVLPVLPAELVVQGNMQGVFEGWMGLVTATTIWSGSSYLFTKDGVVYLNRRGEPRKWEEPYDVPLIEEKEEKTSAGS